MSNGALSQQRSDQCTQEVPSVPRINLVSPSTARSALLLKTTPKIFHLRIVSRVHRRQSPNLFKNPPKIVSESAQEFTEDLVSATFQLRRSISCNGSAFATALRESKFVTSRFITRSIDIRCQEYRSNGCETDR